MLILKPNCENCDKDLPPDSLEARICSFECTFCADCVDHVLFNVCPNCGGGLTPRPVRPRRDLRNGNCLQNHPASTQRVHKKLDPARHAEFAQTIKNVAPELR